jgi:uncharacterized membrane protein YhhN
MTVSIVLTIACPLMFGLLYGEKRDKPFLRLFFKAVLSFLFLLTAFFQPHPLPGYARFLIPGLLFCAGGDIFLALSWPGAFFLGLIAFLVGHIFYTIAFFSTAGIGAWAWAGLPVIILMSGAVSVWLRPHLGRMKRWVMVYIAVISLMLFCAVSMAANPGLSFAGRWTAFSGALLFYISDLFVARNRFMEKAFINRLIGLPTYYFGQFLLAFSVGLL